MTQRRLWIAALLFLVGASALLAQRGRRGFNAFDPNAPPERNGVPEWEVNPEMPEDVFTFVRLRFDSINRGGNEAWATDYPDSDLNFSFRLQELTSLEVDPDGKILDITDPKLFDYPWCYMIEPGWITLSDEEVAALRKYLLNGGFLMVDDFWGTWEWEGFISEFSRVFPDRKWVELEIDHPIFSCVFPLTEKPQVPAINTAIQGRASGITYEWNKPGTEGAHYRAYFDDAGRMMAIICLNTDLGDGWEREGESEWYFKEFSEKLAYPMGINILFYALTH